MKLAKYVSNYLASLKLLMFATNYIDCSICIAHISQIHCPLYIATQKVFLENLVAFLVPVRVQLSLSSSSKNVNFFLDTGLPLTQKIPSQVACNWCVGKGIYSIMSSQVSLMLETLGLDSAHHFCQNTKEDISADTLLMHV